MHNHILRALSGEDAGLLLSAAERVEMPADTVLNQPGHPITHVTFVESGIASLTLSANGKRTEVGMVGCEGALGIPAGLEQDVTLCQTHCVTAVTGFRITTQALASATDARPPIRRVLNRYVHALMLHIGYGALATASLGLRERVARWLLMAHDRLPGDEFRVTHELIAKALTSRRPGITNALHEIEGERAIRSTRGLVTVTDRAKLQEIAGAIYGVVESLHLDLAQPLTELSVGLPRRSVQKGRNGPW